MERSWGRKGVDIMNSKNWKLCGYGEEMNVVAFNILFKRKNKKDKERREKKDRKRK